MNSSKKYGVVVEDSQPMRHLIKLALGSLGISNCVEAKNGGEAISALKAHGADIVIMDWQMDVMDGMECTRQIRSGIDGIDPNLPIILLTALVSEEAKEAAYAARANLFMGKPFSLKQLNIGIAKVMAETSR
jgi:two-component system chemotaxis response regulator CheY/two-component system phosphate regulon response regulator PhoB